MYAYHRERLLCRVGVSKGGHEMHGGAFIFYVQIFVLIRKKIAVIWNASICHEHRHFDLLNIALS